MERAVLFDILKTNIRSVSPVTATVEIQESHNLFYDLRLDSLQAVEVVSRTIRQTQIRLPLTTLARVSTFGDLLDLFQKYGEKSDEHPV
jgi:acyl carrier protein